MMDSDKEVTGGNQRKIFGCDRNPWQDPGTGSEGRCVLGSVVGNGGKGTQGSENSAVRLHSAIKAGGVDLRLKV